MSSLRLKIQKARNIRELDACLEEMKALIRVAAERAEEFQAADEEMDRLIAETMPPEIN
jgi:hypothetical protein